MLRILVKVLLLRSYIAQDHLLNCENILEFHVTKTLQVRNKTRNVLEKV